MHVSGLILVSFCCFATTNYQTKSNHNTVHSGFFENKKKTKAKEAKSLFTIGVSTTPGFYSVLAKNVIGAVSLREKVVIIQPKLSIKNILFMVLYTFNPDKWNDSMHMFKATNEQTTDSLFAAVAIYFVQRVFLAFQQGIVQGV